MTQDRGSTTSRSTVPPEPDGRAEQVRARFAERFGRPCEAIARAPGRVNLIGEHTDYNDGFVFPIALTRCAWVAAAARSDGAVRVVSRELGQQAQWPLNGWRRDSHSQWTSYVAGVASLLLSRGAHLTGADVWIESDVPLGAGLSSSAALELAAALVLAHLSGEPLEALELIDLCRSAEHEFAGVPCGLMDQTVSLLARRGHGLLLDCRSRQVEHVPLNLADHTILVIDSGVRHELALGEYAKRQRECQAALAYFRRLNPAVRALRDVASSTVRSHALQMEPVAAARALHVTSENERTLAAVRAVRQHELRELGELLAASHRSLRDEYEVSLPAVDRLVERVQSSPGVLGARLTGGGFGGCVVALLRDDAIGGVSEAIERRHAAEFPGAQVLFATGAGAGAAIL